MGALAQPTQNGMIEQPPRSLDPTNIVMQVIQSGQSIDVVREVMALTKEIKQEKAREAFDAAIANAKAEIKPVIRNRTGHNNKRYADFAAYAKEIDPVISKFGLSYRFRTTQTDKITVTCVVSHRDGHSEENSLSGPPDASGNKNPIQAIGSTLAYLQRYTLTQAFGLAAEDDDDGNKSNNSQDDATTISEAQAAQIRKLLEDAELDIAGFCNHWKIESVPDLRSKSFNEVVQSLRRRITFRAEQAAKGGNANG